MKLFALDLETTGIEEDYCQILEFGVVFFDTDNPLSYEDSPKFHRIINSGPLIGEPFALQLNNNLLRIIAGVDEVPEGCELISTPALCSALEQLDPYDTAMRIVLEQFANWAKNQLNEGENFRVNLLGKNVGAFDLQWVKPFVDKNQKHGTLFRHRCMDIGPLMALPSDDAVPGLEKCLERCGFDGPTDYHSALGDAWDCIRVLCYKWNVLLPESL